MRQAGRYMPEYRKLREQHSILELCHTPELAAQVTLQPVERLGVDAAILFADILLPFEPLGLGLSFAAGEGPHIANPVGRQADVERLPPVDPEADLGYVLEAVRLARAALPADIPLIGFAGAPFTLASYAIEGGSTAGPVPSRPRTTGPTCCRTAGERSPSRPSPASRSFTATRGPRRFWRT